MQSVVAPPPSSAHCRFRPLRCAAPAAPALTSTVTNTDLLLLLLALVVLPTRPSLTHLLNHSLVSLPISAARSPRQYLSFVIASTPIVSLFHSLALFSAQLPHSLGPSFFSHPLSASDPSQAL